MEKSNEKLCPVCNLPYEWKLKIHIQNGEKVCKHDILEQGKLRSQADRNEIERQMVRLHKQENYIQGLRRKRLL